MTTVTLPRLGLPWVTWRQHRVALVGVFAMFGGLALLMLASAASIHATYRSLGLTHCHDLTTGPCAQAAIAFVNETSGWRQIEGLFSLLPGLIGMFVGAPMLAREFDNGTFRFAWTQGVGRVRWTLIKLVLLAGSLTAVGMAFSLLFT